RSAAPAPGCCVIPRLQLLAQRAVARQQPAWTIRSGDVIAIPESGSPAHVKKNAVALSLPLTPQELQPLDAAHPPPWALVPRTRLCPPATTTLGAAHALRGVGTQPACGQLSAKTHRLIGLQHIFNSGAEE